MFVALTTNTAVLASPQLTLDTGVVKGEHLLFHHSIRAFYGVPFASPPVGDLRWQPPQLPKSWAPSVRSATKYGNSCIQPPGPFVDFSMMSEDCLVSLLHLSPSAPVLIWCLTRRLRRISFHSISMPGFQRSRRLQLRAATPSLSSSMAVRGRLAAQCARSTRVSKSHPTTT